MKKRRIWILSALLTILLVVGLPGIALAASYYIPIIVANQSAGSDYTCLPVLDTINNSSLADSGYIDPSGNDTRVTYSGSELKHMVADDKVAFVAENVNKGITYNYQYTMGNDPLSYFSIIPGYNGAISRTDTPDMELGNNFEIEQKGAVDTSSGSDKNLVYKAGAFRTYISATQSIRSAIIEQTVAPTVEEVTGGTDSSGTTHTVALFSSISAGDLLLVQFAADGNPSITFPNEGTDWIQLFETANNTAVAFGAWYRVADGNEGATIEVETSASEGTAFTSFRITGYLGVPEAGTATTGDSEYPNPPSLTPSWGSTQVNTLWFAITGVDYGRVTQSYPSGYSNGRCDYDVGNITSASARRELSAASEDPGSFDLNYADQWVANTVAIQPALAEVKAVTATGITSGIRKVVTSADGTNFTISVYDQNDVLLDDDTVALAGTSVSDNGNPWYWMQNDVMCYMDYYKHTTAVGGSSLKAHYQPDTMISGTTLPDETTNGYDATISWGANPGTVNVSHGALQILNLQQMSEEEVAGYLELFGEVPPEPEGFFVGEDYTVLPGTDVISELATAGQIPLKIFWVPILFMVIIAIGLWLYARSRHIFGAAIASCIVLGVFCGIHMLPWWVMVPYAIMAITMIIQERTYGF